MHTYRAHPAQHRALQPHLSPQPLSPHGPLYRKHTLQRHCFHRAHGSNTKGAASAAQRTAGAALHLTLLLRAFPEPHTTHSSSFTTAQPAPSLSAWAPPQNAFLRSATSFAASYLSVTSTADRNTGVLFAAFNAAQTRPRRTARYARAASRGWAGRASGLRIPGEPQQSPMGREMTGRCEPAPGSEEGGRQLLPA